MSSLELRRLHQLHLIDAAIVEIKSRAAALDPGRKLQAAIQQLQVQLDSAGERLRTLQGEQADLELKQQGIDAKLQKIDKEMYGGSVVNPREVENLEKEVANLKRQRGELDGRLLELWEAIPPVQKDVQDLEAQKTKLKQDLAVHQKKVLQEKEQLEAAFRQRQQERPAALAQVPKPLLVRYDAIRQKAGGIGMADVVRNGFCGSCGTHLPEKLIEGAREGRVMTCESCHRILYLSEGLI